MPKEADPTGSRHGHLSQLEHSAEGITGSFSTWRKSLGSVVMQDVVCKLCNRNISEFSGPLSGLTYLEKLPGLGLLVLISAMGYGP